MRAALGLARRGYGLTSPNPMVGAVVVRGDAIIGGGWHRKAGGPHAEIEAIRQAQAKGHRVRGGTLYVTLEPCCTHGRTPPCTEAILQTGIKRVIVAAVDPNPAHQGRGLQLLRRKGVQVASGILAAEATRINEAFNHWVVQRTPFVTVKAAMTLDGKIAAASGESKWITGERARAYGMKLREGADAILAGVNTILADDPQLTIRNLRGTAVRARTKQLRRIVLDSRGRIPRNARVVSDQLASLTTVVTTKLAPRKYVESLSRRVNVWVAPLRQGRIDLAWVLRKLGAENVTSLLVEGGGQVNASFLLEGWTHRIAFFYAPRILGGADSIRAVAGHGLLTPEEWVRLRDVEWRWLGEDLLLTARVAVKD